MPYKDKTKQAESAKKHYQKNKELIKNRAKCFAIKARKRNRDFVNEYLECHPCIDCGVSNIVTLTFDHVRGEKHKEISLMILAPSSIDNIRKEIEKCEVRCANCHLIRHFSEHDCGLE